jgi:hypothetical protein
VLYLKKRQNHFLRENKKEDTDAERTEGLSYYNVYAHLLQTNLLAVNNCSKYLYVGTNAYESSLFGKLASLLASQDKF